MNKIILVDDQPIANFIAKKLLEVEGFANNVVDFTKPVEALESAKKNPGAVIFLDLNMPEMNGWLFLENLMGRNLNHKVIILTSSSSQVDIQKAKEYRQVIQYIIKPLNKEKFKSLTPILNQALE